MVFIGFAKLGAEFGSLDELLAELLAVSMAAGCLADGLIAAGWFAGRPQGPQDPEHQVRRWEQVDPWAPTATYLLDSST